MMFTPKDFLPLQAPLNSPVMSHQGDGDGDGDAIFRDITSSCYDI